MKIHSSTVTQKKSEKRAKFKKKYLYQNIYKKIVYNTNYKYYISTNYVTTIIKYLYLIFADTYLKNICVWIYFFRNLIYISSGTTGILTPQNCKVVNKSLFI